MLAKAKMSIDADAAARLAAVLMGAYLTEPSSFLRQGRTCGRQYRPRFRRRAGPVFQAAVTAAVEAKFPSVPAVLRTVATQVGSRIEYLSAAALQKEYDRARRSDSDAWQSRRCLSTEEERQQAKKKRRDLFANVYDFVHAFEDVAPESTCPGFPNA